MDVVKALVLQKVVAGVQYREVKGKVGIRKRNDWHKLTLEDG